MTKQQYLVAAFCIAFMVALELAVEKWFPDEDSPQAAQNAPEAQEPPDEIEDSKEDFEKQKRLAAAWTQTQVRNEVRIAILERPKQFGRRIQILKSLGWRVNESVLEILADPSQRTKLTTAVDSQYFGKFTPLSIAIDLMEEHSSEKLVDPLLPFATHSTFEVRSSVMEVLGAHPSPKTLPLLKRALADGEEHVRNSALSGISEAKKIDPECSKELFPIVLSMLNGTKYYSASDALVALDEQRAVEFFESDSFFRAESPGLTQALSALVTRKKTMSREKLLTLIAVHRNSVLDGGLGRQLNQALHLLGRHQHSEDRELFETVINHKLTAKYASDGYLAYHGLDNLWDRLIEVLEKDKWERLSPPQKVYYVVNELDGEVNNGGLHQYLSNSSGEHAMEALEGLKAIGMTEQARRLKKEFDRMGVYGPSKNENVRDGQLQKLQKKDEDPFEAYDNAYYADKDSVYAHLAIYAVKNKDAFK